MFLLTNLVKMNIISSCQTYGVHVITRQIRTNDFSQTYIYIYIVTIGTIPTYNKSFDPHLVY